MGYEWPREFWPHQLRGCQEVISAMASGDRRIVLTAPTGAGKSKCMCALIEWATYQLQRSILYCHRRMLFDQTSGVLTKHGIEHGLRAAGHDLALLRPVQLAMTQSEVSAVLKHKQRPLHEANLVLSDELHAQGGDMLPYIHKLHYDQGSTIIGVTATPIDLVGDWDRLVVAGTTAECRKCGALVPAVTYCPDEPDMRHIKKYVIGEDLTDKQNRQAMMRPGVFGRVLTNWKRINPEGKPTILFAPDVPGSIYFAEQFVEAGFRAAHIDAKQIWLNGDYMESSDANRAVILQMFRDNDIQVLCNRFVLREGIDLPETACCIMACVFGSLKTYLQAGGRALRSHPSLDHVTIQDHGANYRRHGSLNESRHWELGMKGRIVTGLRMEAMREKPDLEPIICPKCGAGRLSGPTCLQCGFTSHRRSKCVVQINGELKQVDGPSYKPRRVARRSNTERLWISMYHRAKSKKWNGTFNQAEALFFRENFYYPPRDLPFMPTQPADWFEHVADVPKERLTKS